MRGADPPVGVGGQMKLSPHDSSLGALKFVVDMADVPMVITDEDGRFVFANGHTLDIVGKAEDACIGKPLASLLSVSRRPRFNRSGKAPVLFTREGRFYEVDGISRFHTKSQKQNLNSDQVSGIDGMVRWNDRVNDFNYFVGVNLTLARQKTINNYGEVFLNGWDQYRWAQTNRWSNVKNGAVWMWETIGVFQTQEEIDNYPVNIDGANNVNLRPGDLIFKDVNGDGLIDDYDKRPLGYAATDYDWDSGNANKNPLLSMGINLGFEYKGIDFAADFAGGFMNTFIGDWHVKYGIGTDQMGYVYNVIDSWQHEDIFDTKSPWKRGKFPAVRSNNPSIRDWNDFYAKEINYLRLRNLVVGYTLPIKWTKKALIQKLRVYFEGSNLLCWDSLNDFGFDPEISSVTGFDYPQHKVYTVGVNVTF